MSIQKSNMHRAAKILIEQGKAASVKEAVGQLEKYRIAIAVGKEAQLNELSQIALLTAVNSASRVFMGGVYVVGLDASTPCVTNLSLEPLLCDAVREMGGILSASEIDVPTLVIGDVEFLTNSGSACRLSFGGWSGGIIPTEQAALPTEGSNPLSAVLAAALGVASCFRHLAGESKDFGSETSGISLFDPLSDWQSTKGPSTCLTPSSLWLLGLGHLGQAYAWTLASMRFRDARPLVYLQDFDPIEEANLSTGMLTSEINIGQMKTRVVSGWLEKRGFSTRIVEQMFSGQFVLGSTEPRILLGGLDNLEARRHLEGPGFDLIVDAGLSPFGGSYDSFTVKAFTGDGRASNSVSKISSASSISSYMVARSMVGVLRT